MPDRENVIKGLETCIKYIDRECPIGCPYHEICTKYEGRVVFQPVLRDALTLLKEQENLKQKMWNSLYAEEDDLEEKFIGTEKHNDWFFVYRPWLQRGFEIAIQVIAEQEGM